MDLFLAFIATSKTLSSKCSISTECRALAAMHCLMGIATIPEFIFTYQYSSNTCRVFVHDIPFTPISLHIWGLFLKEASRYQREGDGNLIRGHETKRASARKKQRNPTPLVSQLFRKYSQLP